MPSSYATWQEGDIIECCLKDAAPFKREAYTYFQVMRIQKTSQSTGQKEKIEQMAVASFDLVSPNPCTKEEVLSHPYVTGPYFTGNVNWFNGKEPLEMVHDIRICELIIQPSKFKAFQCRVIGNDLTFRETIPEEKIKVYPTKVSAGIVAVIARIVKYEDLDFS